MSTTLACRRWHGRLYVHMLTLDADMYLTCLWMQRSRHVFLWGSQVVACKLVCTRRRYYLDWTHCLDADMYVHVDRDYGWHAHSWTLLLYYCLYVDSLSHVCTHVLLTCTHKYSQYLDWTHCLDADMYVHVDRSYYGWHAHTWTLLSCCLYVDRYTQMLLTRCFDADMYVHVVRGYGLTCTHIDFAILLLVCQQA